MIDGRLKAVTSPEEISKALCDAVVSESLMERAQSAFSAFAGLAFSSTVLLNAPGAEVFVPFKDIQDLFAKDEKNLAETLQKLDGFFEKLKVLPKKPVIIIGTTRTPCSKRNNKVEKMNFSSPPLLLQLDLMIYSLQ